LPFAKKATGPAVFETCTLHIDKPNTQTTLASLIYTAWGNLLCKATNSKEVVFGVVVSGRSSAADDTVGLFINTIPVRFRFDDKAFVAMEELKEYENTPLLELGIEQLFTSIVVVENYPLDKFIKVDSFKMDESTNYDLTITVRELEIEFKYNANAVDGERVADCFDRVLRQMIASEEISILTDYSFNNTAVAYPAGDTIVSMFEEQVLRTPGNIAVEGLTYNELNERANQLAAYLRQEHTVRPGDFVGIKLERTEWMIVAMLGVLKSGGAYVPLDPAYPQERINYMVADSNCLVVIDEDELNKFRSLRGKHSTDNALVIPSPADLAYAIYTSGSTGKPKGVMIQHASVAAFLHWCKDEFRSSDFDVVYAATSICFDLSVYEIFFTLVSGKKIKLLNNALDIAFHLDTKEKVLLNTVPSVVGELLEQKANLNAVTVLNMAGEPVPTGFIDKLHMEVRNLYGPTEDTTYSTVCRMQRGWQGSIGKPKANTEIFILDKWDQPCAIGVAGEICISGRGLAKGYLNKPELTAEKFVTWQGKRIYRTGDLGYWLPNGEIIFVGRADNQVKVRGYRIELGEIESVLRRQVKDAIVTSTATGLCAYVIGEVNKEELSKSLPAYMMPTHYVQLEKFPLTANGKIDRKALPAPVATNYVAPIDAVEEKLVAIWSELLGVEKISTTANFFEFGGHSLKATRLISRIHKEFDVQISLAELFENPRISFLASRVRKASGVKHESIPGAEPKAYYPLSPAQERMYILQQLHLQSTGYNMPAVIELPEGCTAERVENIFQQLIARHESLRTSFETIADQPVQRIHDSVAFSLEADHAIKPFDLSKAPLLRASLDGKFLHVDMHHIISDGVSQGILQQEFNTLYKGQRLAPLSHQYKDYSEWINSSAQQSRIKSQEEFWLQTLSGELPVLELPYDFIRPTIRNFEGSTINFQLPTSNIQQICHQHGITPYMFLLSAINIWLSKLSGEEDIIVLSPVAARRHEELEKIIGLFINTLALRTFPSGDKNIATYLQEVRQSTLAAFEHQEYGFETLVDKLQVKRDMSRNPLSDVMFVMQENGYREYSQQSKFDLTITATEQQLSINYSTQLFTAATMQRLAAYLQQIISADVSLKIKDIELVKEHQQATKVRYPEHLTLTQRFEEQAALHADKIAVGQLTYRELNENANQLAAYLRKKYAVQPNNLIGLLLDRSEWMIVSMLAVLKSGGAYVPIDPNYPTERIEYMKADSNCLAVIDKHELEQFFTEQNQHPTSNLHPSNNPADLAYVIYTSGTTGKPKGTLITHTNVVRLFFTDSPLFDFDSRDVWTFFHSYCFDFSVWEMYGALLFGGRLVIVPTNTARDAAAMLHLLEAEKITVFNQTPSSFYNIIEEALENPAALALRYVIFGGEALQPAKLKGWREQYPAIKLVNMYGITETTVHVTYKEITEKEIAEGRSNIGKPIPTLECFVLDRWGKLVPTGVFGELYVGGAGVGRGYLNREELTAQRFISKYGQTLYRSGDKARWLPNGDLEYGGRLDEQVKVRGYRIELGEIEKALLNFVKEAVVVNMDQSLVAYITGSPLGLKEKLSGVLPDYMVPSCFIQLDKLPLTSNGKLDKSALPKPTVEYMAPRTAIEKQLANIWSEILGFDNISIESDFFETGGHSLKAYTLTSKVHKEFGVRFPLAEIFKTSTIRSMAEYITALRVARTKKENQPIKSIVKI